MENNYNNNDYLEFLEEKVDYGDGKPRPRARKISQWKKLLTEVDTSSKLIDYLDKPEKIWIWSDQHFGHKNIIKYSDRPFDTVEEMDEALIENYCDCVKDDDICLWLGDIAFKSTNQANELLHKCPGYKILVIGNHDFERGKLLRKYHVDEKHLVLNVQHNDLDLVFTHYPVTVEGPMINVHGHVHNNIDGEFGNSLLHINVSVEVIDYKPLNFADLLSTAKTRSDSYDC